MTDILETIDQAAESDTTTDWLKGVLWQAVAEIARLRAKNAELNRRSQKAEAAARDTYAEARRRGVSAGRVLANHAAAQWRDIALAEWGALDNMLPVSACDSPDHRWLTEIYGRWIGTENELSEVSAKARERLRAQTAHVPPYGLPEMNIQASIPPVKPPRKEELAKAMHHVSCRTEDGNMRYGPGMMSPWDTMSESYRSRWIEAAEEAIRKVEAD